MSIIGIFGANHRSEQTKRQIERSATQIQLTQSQNLFSNYYKHLEEFDKFCKIHTEQRTGPYKVNRSRKLHAQMFPNIKQGDYSVAQDFLEKLDAEAVYFLAQLHAMVDRKTRFQAMKDIITQESLMVDLHSLGTGTKVGSEWREGNATVFINGDGIRDFVQHHKERFHFIDELLMFDTDYVTSQKLKEVVDFKTNKLNRGGYVADVPMYVE